MTSQEKFEAICQEQDRLRAQWVDKADPAGKDDWLTIAQALERLAGDCEDYEHALWGRLLARGFDAGELTGCAGWYYASGRAGSWTGHAVLFWRDFPGCRDPYLCDNGVISLYPSRLHLLTDVFEPVIEYGRDQGQSWGLNRLT